MIIKQSVVYIQHRFCVFFVLLCISVSDASFAKEQNVQEEIAALNNQSHTILYRIKRLIGPATCTQDEQCSALPIGYKSCGGPSGYLVYSSQYSNEKSLHKLALRHREIHRQINQLQQLISTCEFLTPPQVACVKGKCQSIDPQSKKQR